MGFSVSPLAPTSFPELPPLKGVKLGVAESNIRYKNRPDLLLVELAEHTQVAGVFTTSLTSAAPVTWCREILPTQKARALIVNAGNANAFTGRLGMEAVAKITQATANTLGCDAKEVFIASTGVIGEPLQQDRIISFLPELKHNLSEQGWNVAAQSIMTTDTFMKVGTATAKIGDTVVTLNGFAKGSGMIAPNMATMLGFVFTDANIPGTILQKLLQDANAVSFNAITVDGDTSTNDTLLAFATAQAKHIAIVSEDDDNLIQFKQALTHLLKDLAIQIVKDGEGAKKLIKITVKGAVSNQSAHIIAMTIGNSPLVKTAIAGEDANWGRIVGAAGRAGEPLEQDRLEVAIGGVSVAKDGSRVLGYDETPVVKHMQGQVIDIEVGLNIGSGVATIYTCDLTHGYIEINGSYRS